ncbi:nicotinamide-nucleotide amidase [Sphingopyxis sp. OAS728]|uniref:CinA family protein n=1 Tax=Sphingopyxis sp. OAS728 TaxID=2663823 RepID=UPI00178B0237|nr:CinA family protein [Sphingopyxis sp. OAS728]MBE1526913.1 nicotinamide-nucleotide amidase [Sphingopyxis sp. OAS728]
MSAGPPNAAHIAALKQALRGTDLRIATAESCTGGQLAAVFAGDTELGPSLERGYVAYSLDAKCDMLGVDRADAERCEAVNPEVARAMADGALEQGRADIAVSVTGFCGPQQADEEVGLVYVATAARDGVEIEEHHFGDIGRPAVLEAAVGVALAMLADAARRLREREA